VVLEEVRCGGGYHGPDGVDYRAEKEGYEDVFFEEEFQGAENR